MVKDKSERAKRSILRRVRKQRLKYITVLPSLITLLNGVCGFAAISFASKGALAGKDVLMIQNPNLTYFAMSGYMILIAMIADMLDGRVARMSKSTSSFGGQLDSLCDMISFGVAPAFLMLKVLECKLFQLIQPAAIVAVFLNRFIWLTAAIYMGCAAIRLARFNVENEEDEAAHMSFLGLPTPASAGVIVSLIIFYQDMLPIWAQKTSMIYQIGENIIIFSLPFITLGVSLLMISRIRYQHILNQYLRGTKPFAYFLRAIAFIVLVIINLEAVLVLLFCGFAISGVSRWFYYKVIAQKDINKAILQPRIVTTTDSNPIQ